MSAKFKIANIFIFMFLHRFISFYTVWVTIVRNGGAGPLLISMLFITHDLGRMVSDVYTGALADRYGIRRVMAAGLCIKVIGISVWIFSAQIYWYFIGMFILGVGRSCTAGKIEVYAYNMLYSLGYHRHFDALWVGLMMIDVFSASLLGVASSAIYNIGYFNLDLFFSIFIILVIHAPFVIFIMPDPDISQRKSDILSVKNALRNVITLIYQDRKTRAMFLMTALMPSLLIVLGKCRLIISNDIMLDFSQIAKIDSASHAIPLVISPIILFIVKYFKIELSFKRNMMLVFASIFTIILFNFIYNIAVIASIIGFIAIYQIATATFKKLLESSVSYNIRSTISSTNGIAYSVLNMFLMGIFGIAGHFFAYQIAFFALLSIVLCILFYASISYK